MTIGRHHYLLIAQLLISGLLLAWLINFAHPGDMIAAARDISPLALLVTGGLLALGNCLAALRQSIILRALGIPVSPLRMIALNWMGLFANNFLPSSVGGDAAIAAVLQRSYRRLGTIISGLLINRIVGLVGLLIVLLFLLLLVDLGQLQNLVDRLIIWSIALLAFTILGGSAFILLLRGADRSSRWLAASFRKLQAMGVTTMNLGWSAIGILLLSIAIMLLVGAACALLGCWQYPAAGFWATATIVLMLQLVQLVPISFNGIGVAESVMAYCLTRIGWPLHEAVLFGLIMRGLAIALSIPGALGLFFAPKKTMRPATEPIGDDTGSS